MQIAASPNQIISVDNVVKGSYYDCNNRNLGIDSDVEGTALKGHQFVAVWVPCAFWHHPNLHFVLLHFASCFAYSLTCFVTISSLHKDLTRPPQEEAEKRNVEKTLLYRHH